MRIFKSSKITSDLIALDDQRRVAFGIMMLERAAAGYFQFQIETGSQGGAQLRAANAEAWSALERGAEQRCRFISVDECAEAAPDSEDYTSPYTSAAIDAVAIACCVLEFLNTSDVSKLVEAAESRRDTVYLFLINEAGIDPAAAGFEEVVERHPLVQAELKALDEDIAFLRALPAEVSINAAVVERVIALYYGVMTLKL